MGVGDRHDRTGSVPYSLKAWVVAERFDGAYLRRIIAKELGGTGPSFDGYRLAAYSSATQGTHTLYYDAVKVGAARAEIEP